MTMYEEISKNKHLSYVLIVVMTAVLIVFGYVVGYAATGVGWFALAIAVIIAVVMSLTGYYKGDKIALATSHARQVTHDDAPQLFNVVEEMSIASGNPMPSVYIIDDSAPNAFATGRDPEHSSIAVTQGLLDKMNREELQGVIAHEMSHVRNYDILFATLVGVMVGAIALMADFFLRWSFFGGSRRSSNDNSGPLGIILVVLALVLAILAPIAARMVQLAISRKREYLADASGVELTRNPNGLANALQKIADDEEVLEVANRATAHLYIAQPIKKFSDKKRGLFDTHPPIQERIRILREMAHQAPEPQAAPAAE
ncbi:MAG: zinc metalloprotease HtpX [Actinobacteria bacterium]|nr:zinc metalloprotease HtpX [Actinomycetota bacterium]